MKNFFLLLVLVCSTSALAHQDYCYTKLSWPVEFKVVEVHKKKYEVTRKTLGKVKVVISRNDYRQNYLRFSNKDMMDLSQEVYNEDWGGDLENRNGFIKMTAAEMQQVVRRAVSGFTFDRLKKEYNMDISSFGQTARMKYRWFYNTKERVTGTSAPGKDGKSIAVYTKLKIFATCK
jgi:hypothetical protein